MTWGWEVIFPTNPDLVDIFGDMDFDFDNFQILFDATFPYPGSQISRNLASAALGLGLGWAWARLG